MDKHKQTLNKNVLEALDDRFKFIFEEFDNILIPFNGDCNSGTLLNSILNYKLKHNYSQKISVFYLDYEAQYDKTTDYITSMYECNLKDIIPYWFCVPLSVDLSISNHKLAWITWNPVNRLLFVRSMPTQSYIYSMYNHNLPEFYSFLMTDIEFKSEFYKWYVTTNQGKTIILNSSNKYPENNNFYNNKHWIFKKSNVCNIGYPLYDFKYSDIWAINSKKSYLYNDMYNLLWKAGIPISQLKIPCSHNVWNKLTLNLYRVIDPDMWARILGRIEGSNFDVFFSGDKNIEYTDVKLSDGDKWEDYCAFLLSLLPREIRNDFIDKFNTSIHFWTEHGGVVKPKGIEELLNSKHHITLDGVSKYSKYNKINVIFEKFPDDTDDIDATYNIPSWKRNTFCILLSDYICQRMGFSRTQKQTDFINWVLKRYNEPETFI